ncbi:MAG: hypothetical protein HXY28_04635 [Hydrogenophilaceae bacterium]|jgi:hypothetical protein|nr:hypothetical protein [Hydrogenophilaceae bacterium]
MGHDLMLSDRAIEIARIERSLMMAAALSFASKWIAKAFALDHAMGARDVGVE